METLIIRDVNPTTKAALKAQAKRNGRSMAAEIRMILDAAIRATPPEGTALDLVDSLFPPEVRVEGGIEGLYGDEALALPPEFK